MRLKLVLAASLLFVTTAQANSEREFIMSCTYGVLAGTLVGAASLAFEDNPGDNLQRVARGASLGLYAGIALGAYTVYYLPKELEKEQQENLDPDSKLDSEYSESRSNLRIFPIVAENQTGLGLQFTF